MNYNERTEIKAGRKIVKNAYEVSTYSKRRW